MISTMDRRQDNPVHRAMEAAAKRYGPGAPDVISAAARTVVDNPLIPDVVKQRLNSSHVWPDVLFFLASVPADFVDFIALATCDPRGAAQRITRIETLIDAAQLPSSDSIQ